MLRVSSSNVLVVPPFECAWLTGPEFQLHDGSGCLSFEVKGNNDVTVIFKRTVGAKRWQPLQLQTAQNGPSALAVEQNYTVILGSHRNSRLKIEKNGTTQLLVENVGCAKVSSKDFTPYWIDYCNGTISVGHGAPGENLACSWKDPEHIGSIQHVGLSCWDTHVSYRNIQLLPSVTLAGSAKNLADSAVLPLAQLAINQLISSLDPSKACVALAAAEYLLPTTSALYKEALQYLAQHFASVLEQDKASASLLPCNALADLLSHPSLAVSEKVLFDLVVSWAGWEAAAAGTTGGTQAAGGRWSRQEDELQQLLPLVRFPLMSLEELQAVAAHPFTQSHPIAQALVQEAFDTHLEPAETRTADQRTLFAVESRRLVALRGAGRTSSAVRLQRRLPASCRELMFVHDGDRNGVVQHIATSYGTQQWMNPVLTKRLVVRASSPIARHTDPKVLVSGQFSRTSFAGPRYEGGQPATWWLLDLGPQHRLACNYYSVRQDGSQEFMRYFKLQASQDLATWTDLRVHTNDPAVRLPGHYASWPVSGPASATPYRAFRLLLTAPTTAATWNLCICYLELYGYFFRDAPSDSTPPEPNPNPTPSPAQT